MKRVALLFALALTACSKPAHITIHYVLPDSLQPSDVAVLTSTVSVADGTSGFASGPGRTVADGVVLSTTTDTPPKAVLTFNQSNGFAFAKTFEFTVLAPSKSPQVTIDAKAYDSSHSGTNTIAHAKAVPGTFSTNGAVTITLVDDRCSGNLCPSGMTCCNTKCVDPTTDTANCGGCGTECSGTSNTCTSGTCGCNGGSACAAGQTCVSGASGGCIDTMTDPFNCGTVGHACGTGETCTAGGCGCGTNPACGTGDICCDGTCDPGPGCPCGGTNCGADDPICCSDACVNTTMGDSKNCGACGTPCGMNETCAGGHCGCGDAGTCNTGDSCCTGADAGCKTLDSDVNNCGTCGNVCAASETCVKGSCVCGTTNIDCKTSNEICCATGTDNEGNPVLGCVDPTNDANCNTCGNTCTSTPAGAESCTTMGCLCAGNDPSNPNSYCTPGETCCANSGCVNFMVDPANCGACGKTCDAGQSCSGGVCQGASGACTPACANGLTCSNGVCVCGTKMCSGTVPACCSGACADLAVSPNCGACGTTCTGLTTCDLCTGKYVCASDITGCLGE